MLIEISVSGLNWNLIGFGITQSLNIVLVRSWRGRRSQSQVRSRWVRVSKQGVRERSARADNEHAEPVGGLLQIVLHSGSFLWA